jgi:hypothetical protein
LGRSRAALRLRFERPHFVLKGPSPEGGWNSQQIRARAWSAD